MIFVVLLLHLLHQVLTILYSLVLGWPAGVAGGGGDGPSLETYCMRVRDAGCRRGRGGGRGRHGGRGHLGGHGRAALPVHHGTSSGRPWVAFDMCSIPGALKPARKRKQCE